MTIQFNFFEFGKNKVFRVRADKITKSAFDLFAFFLLTCCFFLSLAKQSTFFEFYKFEFAAQVQSMALLFFTVSSQNWPLVYFFLYW